MLPPLPELVRDAVAAGVMFWLEGEELCLRGPKTASVFGTQLRERKGEVVALLKASWSLQDAIALTVEADAEVERIGVPGSSPAVLAAAERAAEAFRVMSMPVLIGACERVKAAARELVKVAA